MQRDSVIRRLDDSAPDERDLAVPHAHDGSIRRSSVQGRRTESGVAFGDDERLAGRNAGAERAVPPYFSREWSRPVRQARRTASPRAGRGRRHGARRRRDDHRLSAGPPVDPAGVRGRVLGVAVRPVDPQHQDPAGLRRLQRGQRPAGARDGGRRSACSGWPRSASRGRARWRPWSPRPAPRSWMGSASGCRCGRTTPVRPSTSPVERAAICSASANTASTCAVSTDRSGRPRGRRCPPRAELAASQPQMLARYEKTLPDMFGKAFRSLHRCQQAPKIGPRPPARRGPPKSGGDPFQNLIEALRPVRHIRSRHPRHGTPPPWQHTIPVVVLEHFSFR
ncbi:hypothetical protein MPEAHAMD_5922 [Methylobacterium frigidaeris]|uniref:Uncharacterized protein n=1 Tax=Methylobacterium frigidaeris TaxID=2038277 RepID=A0AA37HGP0_9HYPH|nr:hypothetical protein MPEAHAMD_5922 [Methylobacterium frigidaeris]